MNKPTQSSFDDVAAQASSLARRHTRTDWSAVLVNACVLPVLLAPVLSIEDKSQLKTTAVGDDWLATVSGLPHISPAGMALLSRALEKKGWVSVEEAGRFVELELAASEKARAGARAEQSTNRPGAAMLLARAEQELPGAIDRFVASAKDFGDAAAGVVAFTAEKAIWLGRGMGAAASWMNDLRTSTVERTK